MTTDSPGASADIVLAWEERHRQLAATWWQIAAADRRRDSALVSQWASRLADMRATQQKHVLARRWRGGPRTLLAALDVHFQELAMTAGLAWLLRPDGHHGLGPAVLTGLLTQVGVERADVGPSVRIRQEEQRAKTRADLVVYGSGWTLVVEAKTFAPEQEHQLDRLHELWAGDPAPVFVFLTRGQRPPTTAVASLEAWLRLTWREVGAIARAAAEPVPDAAPGVYDYIDTLEAYHRA